MLIANLWVNKQKVSEMGKGAKLGPLTEALLETAEDMRDVGLLDNEGYDKITMRHLGANSKAVDETPTGGEIRKLREEAHMSQAVFAHYLGLTTGYVSQMERGVKRPKGAVLVLLRVISRKGIEVLL